MNFRVASILVIALLVGGNSSCTRSPEEENLELLRKAATIRGHGQEVPWPIHVRPVIKHFGDTRNPRAVPFLIMLLKESDGYNYKAEAVDSLGAIGDPSAIPALVEVMERESGQDHRIVQKTLVALARLRDERVFRMAVKYLAVHPTEGLFLVDLFSVDNSVFAAFGAIRPPPIDDLLRLLELLSRHQSFCVKCTSNTSLALAQMGEVAKRQTSDWLHSEDFGGDYYSCIAISTAVRMNDQATIPIFKKWLYSVPDTSCVPPDVFRGVYSDALAEILIQSITTDLSSHAKANVSKWLGFMGLPLMPQLKLLLKSPDPNTRMLSARALSVMIDKVGEASDARLLLDQHSSTKDIYVVAGGYQYYLKRILGPPRSEDDMAIARLLEKSLDEDIGAKESLWDPKSYGLANAIVSTPPYDLEFLTKATLRWATRHQYEIVETRIER